jgi:hypothetical protein
MQWLAIVLLSVVTCVTYGIVHDQITVRICVEYFTIGHPPVFETDDPTLLGLGWGVIATWWVGVLLGVPLACACRIGSWPKRSVRSLVRPMLMLAGCSAVVATIAGFIGYVAASNGWVWLAGSIARRVPAEKHTLFLVDLWAHIASYLAGFLGGMVMISVVLISRSRRHFARKLDQRELARE